MWSRLADRGQRRSYGCCDRHHMHGGYSAVFPMAARTQPRVSTRTIGSSRCGFLAIARAGGSDHGNRAARVYEQTGEPQWDLAAVELSRAQCSGDGDRIFGPLAAGEAGDPARSINTGADLAPTHATRCRAHTPYRTTTRLWEDQADAAQLR